MSDITRILAAIQQGDRAAAADLLPLVYDELRKLAAQRLAQETPGQTLQATALVHEAYLRLVGDQRFESRGHFFAAAAEAMRRILVERARQKKRLKHGGERQRVEMPPDVVARSPTVPQPEIEDVLLLDAALTKFAEAEPLKARLVELRYFGGLTSNEAAQILGISASTADRHWVFARAWLRREIEGGAADSKK